MRRPKGRWTRIVTEPHTCQVPDRFDIKNMRAFNGSRWRCYCGQEWWLREVACEYWETA